MTIAKNANRAKQAIANSRDIRCFSLANNFSGEPLATECNIWVNRMDDGNRYRDLVVVSPQEFLAWELNTSNGTKLGQMNDGRYVMRVHSNLWYEFYV